MIKNNKELKTIKTPSSIAQCKNCEQELIANKNIETYKSGLCVDCQKFYFYDDQIAYLNNVGEEIF